MWCTGWEERQLAARKRAKVTVRNARKENDAVWSAMLKPRKFVRITASRNEKFPREG